MKNMVCKQVYYCFEFEAKFLQKVPNFKKTLVDGIRACVFRFFCAKHHKKQLIFSVSGKVLSNF